MREPFPRIGGGDPDLEQYQTDFFRFSPHRRG